MQPVFEDSCRRTALALANAYRRRAFDSVVFASSWPGEGTTTVAIAVGGWLQKAHGLRVLMIRLGAIPANDTQELRLVHLHDSTPRGAGSAEIPLRVVLAPSDNWATASSVIERIRRDAAGTYDFLLVDAPPLMERGDALEAGVAVPHLILVVQAGRTQVDTLNQVRQQMQTFNVRLVAAVINQYKNYVPRFLDRWLTQ